MEDAASKVGVSKKSLDDYLLQLRFGKKFGFDFQKHKDDKVGVLRFFVKNEKTKQKPQSSSTKSSKGKKGRISSSSEDGDYDDGDEIGD